MKIKDKLFLTAEEISEMLGISKGHSYKLIREMNAELKEQGFLVISGKIPSKYFEERWYN